MKTIGVLGGLGPQATDDFVSRVHRAANRLIEPRFNSGYPPMIVHYHRKPPVAMADARSPKLPLEVDAALLDAAAWLGLRADFLVVPANAPHLFEKEIQSAGRKPLVSMIAATLAEVASRGWRRVGVIGFGDARMPVYTGRATAIEWETIDANLQGPLNAAVIRCQEGRAGDAEHAAVRDAVEALRRRRVEGIILGCTELPLMFREDGADLINPAQLLATAAVKHAIR